MPDIDPAALSRSDSIVQPPPSSLVTAKANGAAVLSSQKAAKLVNTAQRIDLEPLYTSLKSAIGDHWGSYKEAISLFILGHLNQAELSLWTDQCLNADPLILHTHNQLIAAIYGNVIRDPPDQGVAPWVSANDKPTVLSKPVSGDAAEQRLKTEVMQLPARDRRRLKEAPDSEPFDLYANTMGDYHQAKQIKLPDTVPASAGGLNKTNWEMEIRKRYSQPLASETGEFPDAEAIHGRMVPICYEEALVDGCETSCAEFMATATEQYIKEVLSAILNRTRSNVPGNNGIMTRRYRKQLEREEEGYLRGEIMRGSANGLLPVEIKEAGGRRAMGMGDLRLAVQVGNWGAGQMPVVVEKVVGGWAEGELEEEERERVRGGRGREGEGVVAVNGEVGMEEEDWGWEGGGKADRELLSGLLDECLAVGM